MFTSRPITFFVCFIAVAAIICSSISPAAAENWPTWRGPNQNGISSETGLAVEWGPEKNVAWRIPLPGPAGATPVIWEDRIFLTSVDGDDLLLMCFGIDGKEQWRQTVGTGNKDARADEGNSASPSPITDGQHIWTFMGTGALGCYTVDGEEVWKYSLQDRYGAFNIQFGMTSTPVLHEGRLFLQIIHGSMRTPPSGEAYVLAVDAMTGEEIWRVTRKSDAHTENKHSYASPIPYVEDGLELLITHGADYTIAYAMSDGSEVWRLGGLNPQHEENVRYHPTLRFVASPAAAPGIVVVPTAKRGPAFAVRPDLKGDITKQEGAILWTVPQNTPDVPSPLIHEGLVYFCTENGFVYCVDTTTGEEYYWESTVRYRHRGSPVFADGKIYLTSRDGKVTVIQAGKQFKLLAENDIREPLAASPAISNGTIYLRSFDSLWAIRPQ